jgi:hypothetical protein
MAMSVMAPARWHTPADKGCLMGMTTRRPASGDEPGSADAVTSIGIEFRDFRGAGPSNSRIDDRVVGMAAAI